jgi:hypothetical protein
MTIYSTATLTIHAQPSAAELAEVRAEMAEQVRRDFQAGFDMMLRQHNEALYPRARPMPTYEEMTAALHRAANPTPADRAAEILNGRPASLPTLSLDRWPHDEMGWWKAKSAVRNVKRTARPYVLS